VISKKEYYKQLFANIRTVSEFAPSSRFLTKKMLNGIDFNKSSVLLEAGAGNGTITKEIIKKLHPKGKLIIVEILPKFAEELKKEFVDSRVTVICDDVQNIQSNLSKINIKNVDHIISSLPLGAMSTNTIDTILKNLYQILKKEGSFVQFQYWGHRNKMISSYFDYCKFSWTLLNLPPSFILTCYKF